MDANQTISSPFQSCHAPVWAGAFGQDLTGYYADLVLASDDLPAVSQRFRWIPPGQFLMGSPTDEHKRRSNEQQHLVRLTEGLWLADTACTQELWEWVMGSNPSQFKDTQNPVEQVSFNDIEQFFERLSSLVAVESFSLPTEAQWEYACRAGTQSPFSFGETITTEQANFDGNYPYRNQDSKGPYRMRTVPVKELPCNDWGLYQMHGNVGEWCSDWYEAELPVDLVIDPTGPANGSYRVLRGGGWYYDPRVLRSACRHRNSPGYRYYYLGFRLLSSARPSQPVAEQVSGDRT